VNLHSLTLGQRRLLVGAVVVVALVIAGAPRLLHRSSAAPVAPPLHVAAPARTASAGSPALVVDVAGAVRRPGLYRLARGSRIADALALAGGFTRRADRVAVNLAAPVADGEEIVVPARGVGTTGASSGGAQSPAMGTSSTAPLDLNTATLEQLDELPGIGPTTAQKILDYRQAHGPFRSVADLDAVPGIGRGRIEQLKGLVIP
jgi:competence protein ComEA